MDYAETLAWMFARLPMYQAVGAAAYRKDLKNTLLLTRHLGNPENNLEFIHIAGTNGKGSTTHMLASILMEAGYKVGYFTSPHLKDFRERIKINSIEISPEFVTDFIRRHRQFLEDNDLSFFEMTVGLALDYFNKENCDIVVWETGLGGRLDSTNVVTPILSVITNIGLDHTQYLGDSLKAIAYEKAGIIKPNVPVVIGQYTPETRPVFETKAAETHSEIFYASDLVSDILASGLKGSYQIHNIKTVIQAVETLDKFSQFKLSPTHLQDGLLNVIQNTGLAGRWQQLREKPLVICDTAHNWDGLELVMKQIRSIEYENLHIVVGFVNDKNLEDILLLFPKSAAYYFCRPDIPRGLDAVELQELALKFGMKGHTYNSVSDAYQAALSTASENDFIYIGGSTFVVAEII